MRLLLLLVIGGLGAVVAAWGLQRDGRVARMAAIVGIAALVAVTADAFLLRPARLSGSGEPFKGLFDARLVTTGYLRLVVGLWGLESLILVFVAWLLGGLAGLRTLLPATLAAITGGTVAMASANLAVGAAAAAATGLAVLMILLAEDGSAAVAAAARELRVALATGAVILAALVVVPVAARLALLTAGAGTDDGTGAVGASVAGPAMGLITIAVGLAVAARWGMLPFHVRVSRVTDLVAPVTLPLMLVWIPVPLTVVTLTAVDWFIAPLALPLEGERLVLVVMAFATLTGASLAAFFHDDLRHAAGYLVIADSGLLLLAIAALDPAAWGPGREWVVVLAASKTALIAWAFVAEDRFQTRSIPDLRGWARRSPLLAAALLLTTLATFGLPGWIAFEVRGTLPGLVAGGPWDALLVIAGLLALPTYLRLLGLGLGLPTSRVEAAAPERIIRRRGRRVETLTVELESPAVPEGAADPTAIMAGGSDAGAGTLGAGDHPAVRRTTARRVTTLRVTTLRAARRVTAALRRDHTELLSGAVLALAVLAILMSWGALDISAAAADPAPIVTGPASD